jgi:hypothetical protein
MSAPDEEYVSEIEERRYCHTCGQPYTGECLSFELHRKIERFRNTERPKVSPEQWAAAHTGKCAVCGEPARLYATGWHCTTHPPVGTPELVQEAAK